MMELADWEWSELRFDYYKTDCNIRYSYAPDQGWSPMQISTDETLPVPLAAACLHYGSSLFEGLKAFRGADGRVRIFRLEETVKRLQASAERLCMPVPTREMIIEACTEVVRRNLRHLPPYGTGAAMYLRPVEIGTSTSFGVKPSDEALFVVFCSPVGPYFKGGIRPIQVAIDREQDRVAAHGTGDVKIGANYAASLLPYRHARALGCASVLFLDPKEHKYLDECVAANFFAIRDGKYITPKSQTILPSITNKTLRQVALDMGLEVEERLIPVEELSTFEECGCCGTGAIIAPIGKIIDMQTGWEYHYTDSVGPVSFKLYQHLLDIQYGVEEDRHSWNTIVEL